MGRTLSDTHRQMYRGYKEEELTALPSEIQKKIRKSLEMTDIESHFGIKDKYFFILMGSIIIGGILLSTYLIK